MTNRISPHTVCFLPVTATYAFPQDLGLPSATTSPGRRYRSEGTRREKRPILSHASQDSSVNVSGQELATYDVRIRSVGGLRIGKEVGS